VNRLQNRARARMRPPPQIRGCETAPDSSSCSKCCVDHESEKGQKALHTCFGKCISLPPPKPASKGVFGRVSRWAKRRMNVRAHVRIARSSR
jgi:hypothetical protein